MGDRGVLIGGCVVNWGSENAKITVLGNRMWQELGVVSWCVSVFLVHGMWWGAMCVGAARLWHRVV